MNRIWWCVLLLSVGCGGAPFSTDETEHVSPKGDAGHPAQVTPVRDDDAGIPTAGCVSSKDCAPGWVCGPSGGCVEANEEDSGGSSSSSSSGGGTPPNPQCSYGDARCGNFGGSSPEVDVCDESGQWEISVTCPSGCASNSECVDAQAPDAGTSPTGSCESAVNDECSTLPGTTSLVCSGTATPQTQFPNFTMSCTTSPGAGGVTWYCCT
jgi:hypothetical protein